VRLIAAYKGNFDMDWNTGAAWWGAVISTLVAWNAIFSRRPVVSLWPDPGGARRKVSARLQVDNPGPTPLLIRNIRQFPSRSRFLVLPGDRNTKEVASAVYDHLEHRKSCQRLWVPPGQSGHLVISEIPHEACSLVVLRWSRQRFSLLPWSVVVVTGGFLRDIYAPDEE
jgi:hypothetical protein